MITTPPERPEPVTLPNLAVMLGVNLDWLRRQFRDNPELVTLARQAGGYRFVEVSDLGRVREILAPPEPPPG
jgi:hypothetical protein